MASIEIGYLNACIAGDVRYTDRMQVTYDRETKLVTVVVTETAAEGGMDGSGGTVEPRSPSFKETCACANGKELLVLVRKAINVPRFSFKRYGKPTQRFTWWTEDGSKHGLSLSLANDALRYATDD